MGRRIVSGGCHPAERKNGDFAALRRLGAEKTATLRLSGGCHLTEMSWMEWRTCASISSSRSSPTRGYSPTALPTRLWARLFLVCYF
ncbi:unnamed protein product [Spirodela intermedia]|uniref:Uncharacterized protein n=1 Tax=Spirodela intermedia TaxID=51605 RepID=A0A7I8IGN7_SPIIN|nr:unnamed protein product [Spirodela intermedia]CAA6657051.1 unnamed protein product [Spirodela intermedia]